MNEKDKRVYTRKELEERTKKVELGLDLYKDAFKEGRSLSAHLETIDPSDEADSLDAFERQLAVRGIRTKSIPEKGIFADKIENFYASDQPQSQFLFPEFLNREMRAARMEQDITGEIIAARTPIDATVYKSIYLDMSDVTKFRMKRVAEGTEVPTAILKTSENAINLNKFGIRIKATYEALRRVRIDLLRVHLAMIGLQTSLDKGSAAVSVLINGDGNDNAATVDKLSDLDSASNGSLTYKAWISFLMNFYPYQGTTVVGNKEALLQIMTMQFPGIDPMMALAQYVGGAPMQVQLAQGVFTTVRLVLLNGAPDDTLAACDKRFALEEVTEIGANITETDKIISSQFNEIVLTEVNGYAKLYNEATRILDLGN